MKLLHPLLLLSCAGAVWAQTPLSPMPTLPSFSTRTPQLPSISKEAVPVRPFSVVGPRGALLGQQDGSYEAWIFPWKIFSGMQITANMQDYAVPINVTDHAAWIDVQPDVTTITYSHANFTIRQIMIAPKDAPSDAGVLVFYQIDAVRPMTLTFSFRPVMQRMWPAESDDTPSPEWVADSSKESGFYILHLNTPEHAAALAMPGTQSGILAPYQERAHYWPLQFVLHFDPAKDQNKLFPLLVATSDSAQRSQKAALGQSLAALNQSAASIFEKNAAYYRNLLDTHTSIETPDHSLNAAFTWAIAAIDQLRVKTPDLKEEALTAGFVGSGDAARPGFGWFFGRDALWSLYAVNSYGDFATVKSEIEFLLRRQQADGKIMHEWSQTADLVDWKSLPYEYASSDATLLLQMAMNDYLQITGDKSFIEKNWDSLQRAWQFQTSHDSADGIYNNKEGSGWVESWIPSMPHQEIYLAALDAQASTAFANLARATGHADLAAQAEQRAAHIRETVEREYYLPKSNFYAFSHNEDGTTDDTPTIFPSVAWWDGTFSLAHPDPMMQQIASNDFSTDWGTRILSEKVSFYDPISYHQGTVWPLFTGWVSVAEYRTGHLLSGFDHLKQNADLTWAQDLGSTTELLSGQFYQMLGRSTAHQLWSSAMVISPIMRGLFGIEWDAPRHRLTVTPHLPADWDNATVRRIPFGDSNLDLTMHREGQSLLVSVTGPAASGVHLASQASGAKLENGTLRLPLPAVEVYTAHALPEFGATTRQMKILDERYSERSLTLLLEAPASTKQTLSLRVNSASAKLRVEGAELGHITNGRGSSEVSFPAAQASSPGDQDGYVQKTVTVLW